MFGPLLRTARKERGFSLLRLSQKTGLSKGYLSGIENEKVNPPMDTKIKKLVRLLGKEESIFLRAAWLDRMPPNVRKLFPVSSSLPKGGQDAVM